MKELKFNINPIGAPRSSRRDKWKPSPAVQRYHAFRDQIKLEANRKGLTELPPALGFIFGIPMPKSWSNKKREAHRRMIHQQKPDLDNLIKAVKDSIAYKSAQDDAHVGTYLYAQKMWVDEGYIELHIPTDEREYGMIKSIRDNIVSMMNALRGNG